MLNFPIWESSRRYSSSEFLPVSLSKALMVAMGVLAGEFSRTDRVGRDSNCGCSSLTSSTVIWTTQAEVSWWNGSTWSVTVTYEKNYFIIFVVCCCKLNDTSYSVSIFYLTRKQSKRSVFTASHFDSLFSQREALGLINVCLLCAAPQVKVSSQQYHSNYGNFKKYTNAIIFTEVVLSALSFWLNFKCKFLKSIKLEVKQANKISNFYTCLYRYRACLIHWDLELEYGTWKA